MLVKTATFLFLCCAVMLAKASIFDDNEARRAIVELQDLIAKQHHQLEKNALQLQTLAIDFQKQRILMKEENARLRGETETLTHELSSLKKKLQRLEENLQERLKRLEFQEIQIDGEAALAVQQEIDWYQQGLALSKTAKTEAAVHRWKVLLQTYPNTAYRAAAEFHLGHLYYAQKNYTAAIASLKSMLARKPPHPQAAEAMLLMANSQRENKQDAQARKTLLELSKKYPQTEAGKLAKKKLAESP